MRKIRLVAAAAALILTGIGAWAISTTRVEATVGAQVDPSQMMMNAKDLPAAHYDDYSLVF
jgi:hypothetical protein